METEWTHWEYSPADFELASEWCEAHGRTKVFPEWLSNTGFILCHPEPVIFFWMYFDPSCTAAFVDWVITKPGTPLPVLKEGIIYALWGPMREAARQRGANTVISRSPAAMARVMTRAGDGWHVYDKELMSMATSSRRRNSYEAM